MPERHALLGPSSAHRWLVCTPSARLEEGVEDRGSVYAEEGTVAHKLAELSLRDVWPEELEKTTEQEWEAVQASAYYCNAMREYIDGYVSYISERMAAASTRCGDPRIFVEQEVDLSEYVPESFGTADCVVIADGCMDVIDLKYGQGNPVSAEDNPQMKLYALGCLLRFDWLYDIQEVRMTIYQPRIENISVFSLSADALMKWAEEELRPRAALAWEGVGEFAPGEKTCKWCKSRSTCRARAELNLEICKADFGAPVEGKAFHGERRSSEVSELSPLGGSEGCGACDDEAKQDFTDPPLMGPEEIAEVLERLPELLSWAEDVKSYALDRALNHAVCFPGFKVVEGTSRRKYADQEAIAAALCKAGFPETDLYKPKELQGLTNLEKLVGKKKLTELAGAYIIKPAGAPVLVPESDKRPEMNSAASAAEDFK